MPAPDPRHAIDAVSALRQTYTEAEITMLQKVSKRLQRGITQPGWAEQKLAEMSTLNRDLASVVSGVNTYTADELGSLVREAEARGAASGARVLTAGNVGPVSGAFTRVSPNAVQALYAQTFGQIQSANLRILRSTLDQYRSIVSQASGLGVTGVLTRSEVSQRMLDAWAKQGLTGFTDRLGRRWEMSAYAEMASRSAITRSFIQGRLDKFKAFTDLVRIDNSPEECDLCRPWEGVIVSQSGRDPQYQALSSAITAGLFHPNCTHSVAPYFPDIKKTLWDGPQDHATDPGAYEEREHQRYLERNVRSWKRREAVAPPGSPEQRAARAKVKEWQARTKSYTDQTGRRRLYDRESVTGTGRRTPTPAHRPPTPRPALPPPPTPPVPPALAQWKGTITGGSKAQQELVRTALGRVPKEHLGDVRVNILSDLRGRGGVQLFGNVDAAGLNLNGKMLKVGSRYTQEQLEFDIIHEGGHVAMSQVGWKGLGRATGTDINQLRTLGKSTEFRFISDYARTGGADEAWAEAYAARVTGTRKKWSKEAEALFKRLRI